MERDPNRGILIVLEGSDSSGKKTQFDLVVEELREAGLAVETADFPQYEETFFGRMVRRYLDGEFGGVGEANPYLISLLYAGDRWQAASRIRCWLAEGKIVIANRYRGSNEAHQSANLPETARLQFLEWLKELELEVYQIPREDLTIVLHVPPGVSRRLASRRGKQDIHERSAAHLETAALMYRCLAADREDWVLVDCSDGEDGIRAVADIHRDILKVLRNRCGIEI